MIKANELRLGNLCWDIHSKQLLKVTDLSAEAPIGFTVVNREKYPLPDGWQAGYIPLTPEWLERMGFEFNADEGYFSYELPNKPQGIDRIKVGNGVYVHQLQNLYFALTGEELTIKDIIYEKG
jgi:hypothetical protein